MTTYNSYETARIANSERAIYKIGDNFTESSELLGRSLQPCNPADYCMTVEEFLADGHKFFEGDVYLNIQGDVRVVNSNKEWIDVLNGKSAMDNKRYILRAAALEEKPGEKVEWVNGDECLSASGDLCVWIGKSQINDCDSVVMSRISMNLFHHQTERLSKPETKQQREKREWIEKWACEVKNIGTMTYSEILGRVYESLN